MLFKALSQIETFYLLDYVVKNPIQVIQEVVVPKELLENMHSSVLMNHTMSESDPHTHTHTIRQCADPAWLSLIISHKCITAAVQTLKKANYDAPHL